MRDASYEYRTKDPAERRGRYPKEFRRDSPALVIDQKRTVADVLDLGNRRVVGYPMDDKMRTELVAKTLTMAVDTRGGDVKGMILHHDRGSQYVSGDFRKLYGHYKIVQSVGRTGSCHDNAVVESFWPTLKREFVYRFRFGSRADARRAITGWINHYNALRQHSQSTTCHRSGGSYNSHADRLRQHKCVSGIWGRAS